MTAAPPPAAAALLGLMDQTAQTVEILTGIKNQFLAAGWSPAVAEQATLETYRSALAAHVAAQGGSSK